MMKKMTACCLALALIACLACSAMAEDAREIHVAGNATVALAADTASLQIGVFTRMESVREAQTENARLMAAVMEAIHGQGVEDKDIITSQFNVYTDYEYGVDGAGREKRTLFYQVQNNVTVTLHDLSMIGAVLDAAMEAGANTSYGISFSSTQANEAYLKALARAVEDASRKAEVVAGAAGVRLGKLMRITTDQSGDYRAREAAAGITNSYLYEEAKAADFGTSITGGDVTVSASVVLVYSMAD